jgi:SAM-dependent methyltransferase
VLSRAAPGADIRAGTAEAIPAPDGALDAVTVAQAFHWFDAPAALAEIHRTLRPHGSLALVWNTFDTSDGWVAALQALVQGYRRGEPQYGRSGWRQALESSGLFGPIEERMFGIVQEHDTAGLLARIGSTSYIATLPDAERQRLFAEVRALVAELPRPIALPYRTDTFVARRS